ncbi:hypothetical protein FQN50_005134 [Emmonsiellopsis sp. PD_5]|nr:hypothetical protein FQN50_005134 [Emmonsiellopsis sp. PD_5]
MVQLHGIANILALASVFASAAHADAIVERTSFGQNGRISSDKRLIPGWQVSGRDHSPEKMSDRIILTPPYSGNKRGALWAEDPVTQNQWTVDFNFRANGEERGSGNLQIWYAKDGQAKVSTSSIYTVGAFDGFALTIDTHSGRGGTIRGFLNDGTVTYNSHQNIDSLAFGHCDYAYRNLGRLSRIQIKQTLSTFEVLVDQKRCFASDKVILPPGNTFGITAASADNPDSFEIFKFALSVPDGANTNSNTPGVGEPYLRQQVPGNRQQQQNANAANPAAATFNTEAIDTRLNELQNRIQIIVSSTERLLSEIQSLSKKVDDRHQEALQKLANRDQANNMEQRMQRIEKALEAVQKDVKSRELLVQFNKLQDSLKKSHSGMMEHLQSTSTEMLSSTPRMGLFIFFIVAFQLLLAGTYVLYKKRRANMPKKFL